LVGGAAGPANVGRRADDLPPFEFETRNVPSTTNPLGLNRRLDGKLQLSK